MSKFKDLTGQRFGNLTVLYKAESKNGNAMWHCKCDCGNEKDIVGYSLTGGKSLSCGKCNRKFKDLSGHTFGRLTVIKRVKAPNNVEDKHTYWLCRCSCKNKSLKVVSSKNLLNGSVKSCGCLSKENIKKVSKNRIKTIRNYPQWFIDDLYYDSDKERAKNKELKSTDKVWFNCSKHGKYLQSVYRHINLHTGKRISGCLKCYLENKKHQDLTGKIVGNILVLEFIDGKTGWKCKCLNCGKEFIVKTGDLNRGKIQSCGCINIARSGSSAENEIRDYILSIGGNDINIYKTRQLGEGKRKQEIDMYIEPYNIGIEYNGSIFHATVNGLYDNKEMLYHQKKFLSAKNMGIHLINIFDVDWNNSTMRDKIKMYLRSIIVKKQAIFARKCEIVKIDKKLANSFFDTYHIQGSTIFNTINYGLYYMGELYAVIGFGKLRLSKTAEGQYELHRYCVKDGYTVIGGANKLLKAFEREYNPVYLRSYSDNDYFVGSIYERLGFKLAGQSKPRYYWFLNGIEYRRESCKLSKLHELYPQLYDEAYKVNAKNKEDYIMVSLGACKVYRSGNTKWEKYYNLTK